MDNELVLSTLGHTWILDLDGTIVKHNGYKEDVDGMDSFLEGALDFLHSIPKNDMIVFITSRTKKVKEPTESFLKEHGVRFDHIVYNAPYGERILFNDDKPSGLKMGYCINTKRDEWCKPSIKMDEDL